MKKVRRLLSCFLIFLHTLANARVLAPMEEIEACFFAGPGGIATKFGAGVASALEVPAVATPFVSGIAAAGAKSALIQGGLGLLNNQGNVFKAVEDLGKPTALKSIATAIATAGLIGPAPEGGVFSANFAENLATHGAQHLSYGLKAGAVSFAINGGSAKDALKTAGLLAASSAVQASVANELGILRKEGLDSATHKIGHALAGAAAGAILDPKNPGKGAAAGAIGAVVGETVAEWQLGIPQLLENKGKLRPEDLPNKEQTETAHNLARLSAATAALLMRQDVGIAAHTANTAFENNNKLVVEGLKYVAKLAWQKSKHLFAKRAAKEVQKESAKKSAKGVAKELQKPQKVIGKRNNNQSGFLGKKGFELKNAPYQKNRNLGDTINGNKYSGHALDQMQNRGILPSIVENTIKNGSLFQTRAGTVGYYDSVNKIRVIINASSRKIVTVVKGKL
ncbi:MAG: DUF637 domain-containing protein [Alphaproteobacteria bacterium]